MNIIYLGLINVSRQNLHRAEVKKAAKILFHNMMRWLHPTLFINLQVKIGQKGKPYLSGHPSWHFNVSHAGGMGVCAIGRIPVGVDIESIDKQRNWQEIAEHCFHDQEIKYLQNQGRNSCTLFYHLWTRKESWLKLHDMSIWQMSQTPCCFDLSKEMTDVWTWKGIGLTSFSLSLRTNAGGKKILVQFIEEFIPEGIRLQQVRLKGNGFFPQSE